MTKFDKLLPKLNLPDTAPTTRNRYPLRRDRTFGTATNMKSIHIPSGGPRYWLVLCLASVNIGLGLLIAWKRRRPASVSAEA